MNLVIFSIKTKGIHNFTRRLWSVFTRFGFSETRTRRTLHVIMNSVQRHHGALTFFIPAVVLDRHPALIAEIVSSGAEIGLHGYVHNDYRALSREEQYEQTRRAISTFKKTRIPYQGVRNPYLGWTEDALQIFSDLGIAYESNEAVLHEVINLDRLSPTLRRGYEKSLELFQAVPCETYSLRPHFEGALLRIPTSIPDDEMLVDRLRITNPEKVGRIWSEVMQRVYAAGGIYTLNIHPERGILCRQAIANLLSYAGSLPLPVWVARLADVAQWWKERSLFRLSITAVAQNRWHVEASCSSRATLLARHLTIEDQPSTPWFDPDIRVQSFCFTLSATRCPCIGLSLRTPEEVVDFLHEQGYPSVYCSQNEAEQYALYLDLPEGLGATRQEQLQWRITLVEMAEQLEAPFLHFGCWPDGSRAALAISGDIDSVTIQDFFLRILEVR